MILACSAKRVQHPGSAFRWVTEEDEEMWVAGCAANGIVAIAYFAIAFVIARPLAQTRQLRSNRLGVATAAIFLTCAVHHGTHAVHLLGPTFGYDEQAGLALREAFGLHVVIWDILTALVGVYY